jgi:hypothetical protein
VAALVFKNLLALKVGTIGSLLELTSVVIISDLQVAQGVVKSLNFLFALSDFAIKFITVALKLFFLLCCLNYEVSLRVLCLGVFLVG